MSPIPSMNTSIDSDLMKKLWNTTNSTNLTYFTNLTNIDSNFTSYSSLEEYNQIIITLFQIICNTSSPHYNSTGFNGINIDGNGSGFIDEFNDEYDELIYPINNCSNFFNLTNNTKPDDNNNEIKTIGLVELCIVFTVIFGIACICICICACLKNICKSICDFMDGCCSYIGKIGSSFYRCLENITYSIKRCIMIKTFKIFDNNIPKTSLSILKKNNNMIYSNECAICMEPFKGTMRVLSCRHAFHKECLKPWIKSALLEKRNPECPVCRQEIYSDIAFKKKINIFEGNLPRRTRQPSISYEYYSSSSGYSDQNDYY